jgi:hypothetical protein
VLLAVPGATLGRWMPRWPAPPDPLAESLLFAGAHSMAERPGRPIEATLVALLPHAPEEGRAALVQGYGMRLGSEATHDRRLLPPLPTTLWTELVPDERTALLVGLGCGLTVGPARPAMAEALAGADPDEARALAVGVGLCAPTAELRFGCPLGQVFAAMPGVPASLSALGEGLRQGGLPESRLDEAAEAQGTSLRRGFHAPTRAATNPGATLGGSLLDRLPPRPGLGCPPS